MKRGLTWVVAIVLAVLATSNLYVPDLGGPLADPTTIALGAALLLAAIAWARDGFRLGVADVAVGVVVVAFLPGLLTAADHSYGRFKVWGLLAAFVATAAAVRLLPEQRTRTGFLWSLGVIGAGVSLGLVLFGETGTYYGQAGTYYGQASLFELNPIGLGRITALGALVALLAAVRSRGAVLVALLAVAAMCGYAAYTTGTRGPVLAAAVSFACAQLPGRVRPRTLWVLGSAVAAALACALWAFADASTGRVELWRDSLALALHRPGGIGFGGLYGNVPMEPWDLSSTHTFYSHNVFVEAAVEGGWVALAGLLVVVATSLRCLYGSATTITGRAMLAVWVFAMVNACLSSDLVGNRLVWVMFGAGLALLLAARAPVAGTEHLKIGGPRPRLLT